MKVAVTVWGDRISPVFDSAHTLLVAEIKDSRVVKTRYESFDPDMPSQLTRMLDSLGVSVLICGAISELPARTIETDGIDLIPFISGAPEEVLACYATDARVGSAYLMPGCGGTCHRKKDTRLMPDMLKKAGLRKKVK